MIANDAYDDKVKVLASGGGILDAFWIRSTGQVRQYAANNALVNLKPLAEENNLDISPIQSQINEISDEDGGFYGLPTTGSAWLLFYNKDLFDKYDKEYPGVMTWTEYADLALELSQEASEEGIWGGLLPNWSLTLGAGAGDEYLTEDTLDLNIKYVELLNRIYNEDASHPGIPQMSATTFDIYSLWENSETFMMVNGDWTIQITDPD